MNDALQWMTLIKRAVSELMVDENLPSELI